MIGLKDSLIAAFIGLILYYLNQFWTIEFGYSILYVVIGTIIVYLYRIAKLGLFTSKTVKEFLKMMLNATKK